ncbi:hypothetical protein B0I37DRAFT_422095 [Chaetomium sp. MPI-CAGE-AT-0009]|nr:hypothetical protein B0I37DRAFT_422095 [Chaetomium sp. MPI-CAGE-AT-0009]
MLELSPEIILRITEELGYREIQGLMLTSESNMNLIKSYEQSIVKARICRMIEVPQFRPPLGAVISFSLVPPICESRSVRGPMNLEVVKELELRDALTRKLLDPDNKKAMLFHFGINEFRLLGDLTPEQMARVLARLKETLQLMDRILDCAATMRHEFALDPTLPYPGFATAGLDRVIHRARQELIATLCPLDLAFLCLVTFLADSTGGTVVTGTEPIYDAGTREEMLLQNGTMGVYHSIVTDGDMNAFKGLASYEAMKVCFWDAGMRSQAPNWVPAGVLEPLGHLVRRKFTEKLPSIPKKHLDAMEEAKAGEDVEAAHNVEVMPFFWLIRRWLTTKDETLEERPAIPRESWKELFGWAVTQDPGPV